MYKKLVLSLFLILSIFSSIEASPEVDVIADQLILDLLASDNFSNTLIHYNYDDKTYPIRLIHNPNKVSLFGEKGKILQPISKQLIVMANLPVQLTWHLDKILPNHIDNNDKIVDLRNIFNETKYDLLEPVYIATTIDDPLNTEILARILSSNKFQNKILYYQLDGEYYRIRVLYNPENLSFKTYRKYRLDFQPSRDFGLSWEKKYAIVADKKAPKELIDFLSQCLNCSWREWYFNFDIRDGSKVRYSTSEGSGAAQITRTYELDTFFDWMGDFILVDKPSTN